MVWAAFSDHLLGLGLNSSTVNNYVRHASVADLWLRERGATLEIATATQIAIYAATLVNSHATRGQAAAAFNHYWDWLDRDRPPRRAVRVPPQPLMVCRAVEPEEATRLRDIARGWWPEGTAVLFGLYMALRRAEIAVAEWQRFDRDLTWYTVLGKRSKTATLPVHPVLQAELAARRQSSGWIFAGRFGGHVALATIWDWTRQVAEEAGISDLTPHRLRHTSLATANDNLGDLRAVQSFARHERLSTTSGYTRTTAKRLQEVVASLKY